MKAVSALDSLGLNLLDVISLEKRHCTSRYCPVCDSISKTFKKGGTGEGRSNAKCPSCGSLERHRLMWLHLADRVWPSLPDRKKDILHIAPERFLVEKLKSRADVNYISGDLIMADSMAKINLTQIQFWNDQFDLIICSHVLEHIDDDRKGMGEMLRILRPGGVLVVMVPLRGEETIEDPSIDTPEGRLARFGQDDHVRIYGRDIKERLEGVGFSVNFWPTLKDVDEKTAKFISAPGRIVIECRKL